MLENFKVILLFALFSFTMLLSIALNISIVRAIIGFLFLTFIPGMILIILFKVNNLELLEFILFSLGLSLAYILLLGLLLNFLGSLIGIYGPLSLTYFLGAFLLSVGAFAFLSIYASDSPVKKFSFPPFKISKKELLAALPLAILPILSVVGALVVNIYGNNFVLLSTIFFTSITFIIAFFFPGVMNKHYFFAFAIMTISPALLFQTSLVSNYIYGGDVHMEYHVFRITQYGSYWNPVIGSADLGYNWLNAMLSITILPTIYSNFLGVEGTWIFKVVAPIIFSFVCLGLYQLYIREFDSKIAFLSVIFFMSNSVFFTESLGNIRQMLAELFYVLLFLLLLYGRVHGICKVALFIMFSFALVVSHYSTAYIFLFIAIGVWLSKYIGRAFHNPRIDAHIVITFSTIMFSWYIYISNAGPFRGLLGTIDWIKEGFINQFFSPEARGEAVLAGLGLAGMNTFWHILGRGFFYLTELLIVVGFLFLVLKPRSVKVSREYLAIVSLNMMVLVACVVVPFLANTLNMTRFYHITLFFLAPLFAIGGLELLRLIRRKLKTETGVALLMCVLVPFFLFQTGFVYEITGAFSYSIPLSKNRMGIIPYVQMSLITEYDAFGAKWVLKKINYSNALIYSDLVSSRALNSYGMIYPDNMQPLTNTTLVKPGGVIYLGWVNVMKGKICNAYNVYYNITELDSILQCCNRIYSSGGCELYQSP